MNSNCKKIERGQIYFVDLDPVIGSEQGGSRPVLVVQNNIGNQHSPTIIVAPITSKPKSYYLPTHVLLSDELKLPQNSMVLLEQVRTIDKSRLTYLIGCASDDVMSRIDKALGISVGLHDLSNIFQDISVQPEKMTLCLCPVCASQFYNSPDHIIRRVDPLQSRKETCTYCNVRNGYDYFISKKKKRLGDDRI